MTLFSFIDQTTGDGLRVDHEGSRVVFDAFIDGERRLLVLVDHGQARKLAHALLEELGEQ